MLQARTSCLIYSRYLEIKASWDQSSHIRDLEKAMATHSSTLAWKIPWTEEPGRLQSMGSLELDTTERLHFHISLSCIKEGNGNPLQCSFLENPRDGEAWWAAVYGVTQSRTRLKWLSSKGMQNLSVLNFSYFRTMIIFLDYDFELHYCYGKHTFRVLN